MKRKLPPQFWLYSILMTMTSALTILSVILPDWIEQLSGLDPDGGSGRSEQHFVACLCFATVVFALLAYREGYGRWRLPPFVTFGIPRNDFD